MSQQHKISQKELFKMHNLIAASCLFGLLFHLICASDWNIGSIIQTKYEYTSFKPFSVETFDKQIPILAGFIIPYKLANIAWVALPIAIYAIYGKRRFAKLIIISLLIYTTNLSIRIVCPISSFQIEEWGRNQIDAMIAAGDNSWCMQLLQKTLATMRPYSCFPSDHCADTLILTYAFIDFNYFDTEDHTMGLNKKILNYKAISWTKLIWTIFIVIFCLLVCFATFALKIHYFVDFIASLGITAFWWIFYCLIKRRKFTNGATKLFTNIENCFGYYDPQNGFGRYNDYLTWSVNHNMLKWITEKSPTKQLVWRYILIDILAITIMVLEGCLIFWYALLKGLI